MPGLAAGENMFMHELGAVVALSHRDTVSDLPP